MNTRELTEHDFDKRYEYFMHEYAVIFRSGDVQLLASRHGGFIVRHHDDDRYHGSSRATAIRAFNDVVKANKTIADRTKAVICDVLDVSEDAVREESNLNGVIYLAGGERECERNEIMEHTEDEFNIKIEDHVFKNINTVQDLINLVKGHGNEQKENVV